jgi:hypothetical protein
LFEANLQTCEDPLLIASSRFWIFDFGARINQIISNRKSKMAKGGQSVQCPDRLFAKSG